MYRSTWNRPRARPTASSTERSGPWDGPLYGEHPASLTGGEAIPAACYKTIIRQDRGHLEVLAFIMPQSVTGHEPVSQFLISVAEIQRENRLDFLQDLPDDEEVKVEAGIGMW